MSGYARLRHFNSGCQVNSGFVILCKVCQFMYGYIRLYQDRTSYDTSEQDRSG
jgi:hypothetical protein